MKLNISHLQAGEEKAVVRIHNRAFSTWATQLPDCFRYQSLLIGQVSEWLKRPSHTIRVARLSKDPIGYAACRRTPLSVDDKTSVLHFDLTHEDWGQSRIAVLPEFQGRGVASRLLHAILSDYGATGGHLAIAYGYNFNPAASRLFTRLAFVNRELFSYAPYSSIHPFTYDSIFAQLDLTKPLPKIKLNCEVSIRSMENRDASHVWQIFRDSAPFAFGGEPSKRHFTDWLMDDQVDIRLVAETKGIVVGLMECFRDGAIGIPGVLPAYRRQGIGTTLFFHLLEAMQRAGYPLAIGDTGLVQQEMIRLYHRIGFDCSRRLLNWVKEVKQSD